LSNRLTDQCIAFAAVAQSAMLVHNKALARVSHERYADCLLESIFVTDPDTVRDVYPEPPSMKLGLETGHAILSRPDQSLIPVLQYTVTLIDLGQRLTREPRLVAILGRSIEDLALQRAGIDRETLQHRLSAIYQNTVSTLPLRVHVKGSAGALQRPEVADSIRALLLAGIRGAWLWRQTGGRRWHLIFKRSTIRERLAQLAASIDSN
jgi:high frequency lysogenization protein